MTDTAELTKFFLTRYLPKTGTHTITHFEKTSRKKLLLDPINPFQKRVFYTYVLIYLVYVTLNGLG
jgi:hypothetical protein